MKSDMKRITTLLILIIGAMMLASCSDVKNENEISDRSDSSNQDINTIFETVCSAEEALELSRKTDTVVFENQGCTSGSEIWDSFYQTVMSGSPAKVLCAHYYILDKDHISPELYEQEKDMYPTLFFSLIEYDGKEYSVKTRECSAQSLDYQNTFQHLLHFTGEAPSDTALYSSYDNYVLVDDPAATMEGIWEGLISSQYNAGYKHYIAYENYLGWKDGN